MKNKQNLIRCAMIFGVMVAMLSCAGKTTTRPENVLAFAESKIAVDVKIPDGFTKVENNVVDTPRWVSRAWELQKDEAGNTFFLFTSIGSGNTSTKAFQKAENTRKDGFQRAILTFLNDQFDEESEGNNKAELKKNLNKIYTIKSELSSEGNFINIEKFSKKYSKGGDTNKTYFYITHLRYVTEYSMLKELIKKGWINKVNIVPSEYRVEMEKTIGNIVNKEFKPIQLSNTNDLQAGTNK